jgi:hypothetical protein
VKLDGDVNFTNTFQQKFLYLSVMRSFSTFTVHACIFVNDINLLLYKQLNVVTLSHTKSDNINRMITVTSRVNVVSFNKWDCEM